MRTIIHPCAFAKHRRKAHELAKVITEIGPTTSVQALHTKLEERLPKVNGFMPQDPVELTMQPVNERFTEVTAWVGGRMILTVTDREPRTL